MYYKAVLLLAVVCALNQATRGNTCVQPTTTFSHYVSNNEKLSKSASVVVEFTLKCKNDIDGLLLFADIEGNQVPVTRSPEGNNFQISWTSNLAKSSRSYKIRFFDEEGYSNIRKAIRSDQDTSTVKDLFNVEFQHPGLSSKLWIRSELLALIVSGLVFYLVCKERAEVIA